VERGKRAEPCTHVLSAVFRDQPTEAPGFPFRVGYEPNRSSLCAQGIFQADSGFANSLIGF